MNQNGFYKDKEQENSSTGTLEGACVKEASLQLSELIWCSRKGHVLKVLKGNERERIVKNSCKDSTGVY